MLIVFLHFEYFFYYEWFLLGLDHEFPLDFECMYFLLQNTLICFEKLLLLLARFIVLIYAPYQASSILNRRILLFRLRQISYIIPSHRLVLKRIDFEPNLGWIWRFSSKNQRPLLTPLHELHIRWWSDSTVQNVNNLHKADCWLFEQFWWINSWWANYEM